MVPPRPRPLWVPWSSPSGRWKVRHLMAGLIFGLSLAAMFTISSLYHSVGWQERRKAFMQRLDHSMIFLVVAATFTPFGVVVLDGWLRAVLLAVGVGGAIVGIALKFALPRVKTGLSVAIQHSMGWLSLAAMPLIWQRVGPGSGAARLRRRHLLHGRNRDLRDQEAPALSEGVLVPRAVPCAGGGGKHPPFPGGALVRHALRRLSARAGRSTAPHAGQARISQDSSAPKPRDRRCRSGPAGSGSRGPLR